MNDIKKVRFEYVGPEGEKFEGYRISMPSGKYTMSAQVVRDRTAPSPNVQLIIEPINLDNSSMLHNVNANRLINTALTVATSMVLELENGNIEALKVAVIDAASEQVEHYIDIISGLEAPSLTDLIIEADGHGAYVELAIDRISVNVCGIEVPSRFLTTSLIQSLALRQGI